jgi:hypothetical protein
VIDNAPFSGPRKAFRDVETLDENEHQRLLRERECENNAGKLHFCKLKFQDKFDPIRSPHLHNLETYRST